MCSASGHWMDIKCVCNSGKGWLFHCISTAHLKELGLRSVLTYYYPISLCRSVILLLLLLANFEFKNTSEKSWDMGMFTTVQHPLFFWQLTNVVSFLSDIGLLKSPWPSLSYVYFCNVLRHISSWWKVWTADRPFKHLESCTTEPWCCNRYSLWFSFVLLKYATPQKAII